MPHKMKRAHYAEMFGPTTGDKVTLGDTCLVLEVEKDHTVHGDECKFGGGKVIREGMGQAAGVGDKEALDTVITNALVVDYTGIYKADIGIKGGLIAGIGKAGNPDVMAGVTKGMIIGVTTEVIAGEGLILTAGGLDTHIHYICPQQAHEAIAAPGQQWVPVPQLAPLVRSIWRRCCGLWTICRSTSVLPARETRLSRRGCLSKSKPVPLV